MKELEMRDYHSLDSVVFKSFTTEFVEVLFNTAIMIMIGVPNGTSKNVGLGKFWQDLEISEAFLISLEVSFFHGLFLLF